MYGQDARGYPPIEVPDGRKEAKPQYDTIYDAQWSDVQQVVGRLTKEITALREKLFKFMSPDSDGKRADMPHMPEMSEASLEVHNLAIQLMILADDIADIRNRVLN